MPQSLLEKDHLTLIRLWGEHKVNLNYVTLLRIQGLSWLIQCFCFCFCFIVRFSKSQGHIFPRDSYIGAQSHTVKSHSSPGFWLTQVCTSNNWRNYQTVNVLDSYPWKWLFEIKNVIIVGQLNPWGYVPYQECIMQILFPITCWNICFDKWARREMGLTFSSENQVA